VVNALKVCYQLGLEDVQMAKVSTATLAMKMVLQGLCGDKTPKEVAGIAVELL